MECEPIILRVDTHRPLIFRYHCVLAEFWRYRNERTLLSTCLRDYDEHQIALQLETLSRLRANAMNDETTLTAEEFAARKDELPDGGRWVELIEGRVVTYDPPDVAHGNVVLNFSKQLATNLESAAEPGYACFELGLIVGRDPDTVRVPQVSYYQRGELFTQTDQLVTQVRPTLVIEIASTNDRRRDMASRVQEYLQWGVERVWVIDPIDERCHLHTIGRPAAQLAAAEFLSGKPFFPEFEIRVQDLFTEPAWWRG